MTDSIIARGTSPDGDPNPDLTAPPVRSPTGLNELPNYSLNPVFAVLAGTASDRCKDEAWQSLAFLSAVSAVHILRGIGGDGSSHAEMHFHRSADFLDDLLQPDDDSLRSKQARPPCYFTLGCQW